MDQGNVQSPRGITLVGGGAVTRVDLVDSVARAPIVVAADGGANTCLAEGFAPDAVIGDFDSISKHTRTALPDARFIEISEQETTDFEKCLSRIDAPFVLAIGFAGPRLDHALSVLSVIARRERSPVILLGEDDIVFAAPTEVALDVEAGTRVSLFPMRKLRGSSKGLMWPVDEVAFDPMAWIGTSNVAEGPVRLEFADPGCLVIMPRAALDPALAGLTG